MYKTCAYTPTVFPQYENIILLPTLSAVTFTTATLSVINRAATVWRVTHQLSGRFRDALIVPTRVLYDVIILFLYNIV